MYMTPNVYEKYVTYYDLNDVQLFHELVEIAKQKYLDNVDEFESLTSDDIDVLKRNHTPVLFASTVSNRISDDRKLLRTDMNDRARRKYLIIDADFQKDEHSYSENLYDKIIAVASKYNTPLIIYPTASYPDKPRFRAVMFTKKLMNESQYYQAMTWWYKELDVLDLEGINDPDLFETLSKEDQVLIKALDSSNKHIRSNNNAPFFINDSQLDHIYDNTDNDELEPLDNSLWKNENKPKLKKAVNYGVSSELDTLEFTDEMLEIATKNFAKTEFAKDYSTFWRFLHSVARAEILNQITKEQVDKILDWVTVGGTKEQQLSWKLNNKLTYANEYTRVATRDNYMKSAKPLAKYDEFKEVLLTNNN